MQGLGARLKLTASEREHKLSICRREGGEDVEDARTQ